VRRLPPGRGVALSDIWLPATWNRQPVDAVQLCFSEIQLSAARVKRLEEDPELRARRCQSPALPCDSQTFERLFDPQPDGQAMLEAFGRFNAWDAQASDSAAKASVTWRNLAERAFPLSLIAPQRARQSGFEYGLEHPGRYVCDLSGQFAAQRKFEARRCLAQWEQGATPDVPATFESSAWADCLATLLQRLQEKPRQTMKRICGNPSPASSTCWRPPANGACAACCWRTRATVCGTCCRRSGSNSNCWRCMPSAPAFIPTTPAR
jgi:hypothetical protein